jgi:uncharacterized membrane protein
MRTRMVSRALSNTNVQIVLMVGIMTCIAAGVVDATIRDWAGLTFAGILIVVMVVLAITTYSAGRTDALTMDQGTFPTPRSGGMIR